MKCFVFLVCTSIDEGNVKYALDSIHHMTSYEMLKRDNNPQEVYAQRSALIGKDHKWSIELANRIERDAKIFRMMELRERLNQRLTLHCVKSEESLDHALIKTLFNTKIETGEIVQFLEQSMLSYKYHYLLKG